MLTTQTRTYTLEDIKVIFCTDDVCLELIFNTLHKRGRSCGGSYKPLARHKHYQCSKCGRQITPTSGTIFHDSDFPLTDWFYAIYGASAQDLERRLGITHAAAMQMLDAGCWMLDRIREVLAYNNNPQSDEDPFVVLLGTILLRAKGRKLAPAH